MTAIGSARLAIDAVVENLTGHKLPTAYPSRRAWIHLTVRDRIGRLLFESGATAPNGAITGNDNDADAGRFEPHYTEISSSDQVQIYESIMADSGGSVRRAEGSTIREGQPSPASWFRQKDSGARHFGDRGGERGRGFRRADGSHPL